MSEFVVEQAVVSRTAGGSRILARSPGFLDDWEPEVERLAAGFGERPDGVACPGAVFAQPVGARHLAVVQAADLGGDEASRPLGFHFLIVPRDAYVRFWGDPFPLADRVPPAWQARGSLPSLSWPAEALPPRRVGEVQEVLKQTKSAALPEDEEVPADWDRADVAARELSLSPALLGGVQALVDGGRVVFERPAPDPGLLRGLWTLLPTSTRCELWPASFAFGNALQFDALVVPPAARAGQPADVAYPGYTTEDQACDYPQGSYELNLQIAAEAGNQADLDALFARRSWGEVWRVALTLLVVFILVALALHFIQPAPQPDPHKAAAAAGVVGIANPWGALGILKVGNSIWLKKKTEAAQAKAQRRDEARPQDKAGEQARKP
jgi:hypothetical protein